MRSLIFVCLALMGEGPACVTTSWRPLGQGTQTRVDGNKNESCRPAGAHWALAAPTLPHYSPHLPSWCLCPVLRSFKDLSPSLRVWGPRESTGGHQGKPYCVPILNIWPRGRWRSGDDGRRCHSPFFALMLRNEQEVVYRSLWEELILVKSLQQPLFSIPTTHIPWGLSDATASQQEARVGTGWETPGTSKGSCSCSPCPQILEQPFQCPG